jgi:hypothetical protein
LIKWLTGCRRKAGLEPALNDLLSAGGHDAAKINGDTLTILRVAAKNAEFFRAGKKKAQS